MENVIKPDKKYYTAQLLILSILSSIIIIGTIVLNLIIYNKEGSDSEGIIVIWLICLSNHAFTPILLRIRQFPTAVRHR